jgi:ankyrin repeat protein
MLSNYITGPKINNSYIKSLNDYTIYDNGKEEYKCEDFNFQEYQHVIINAHGKIFKEGKHEINLCSISDYTHDALKQINSNNNPLDIELLSCYSGAAISDISALSQYSTLITLTSSKQKAISSFSEEIITKYKHLSKDNPFITFVSYIFSNPDDIKFATNSQNGEEIFISLIDPSISNLTTKEYQHNELYKFIEFCKSIKSNMNEYRSKQINEMIDLFKDSEGLNEWIDHYNERYNELLLINMTNHDNLNAIQKLLYSGVNVNTQLINGLSSLHVAAMDGHTEIVRILIKAEASVNLINNDGKSPLYLAAMDGNTEIVKILLDGGANVDLIDNDGNSPLYLVAGKGHTETVKILLEGEASVNLTNKDGNSPLYISTIMGHTETTKALIEGGASVNLTNKNGFSPLYISAAKGDTETTKALIEGGASVNLTNKNGFSPLYISAAKGDTETVKTLIKAKANVDLIDNDGNSPLYLAAQGGHTETITALIKAEANINLTNKEGVSPLHASAMNGHTETAKTLIEAGASVNLRDIDGFSPLYLAAMSGHTETVKALIEGGSSVNLRNKVGNPPLFTAYKHGHSEIIDLLLAAGANSHESHPMLTSHIQKNPIEYILKHNTEAKFALNAMKNLETQSHLSNLLPIIEETEDCLMNQPEGIIEDLNDICGDHGSFYSA